MSNIRCDNYDLSLAPLYILTHGKTWYEYNFNAEMSNLVYYNNYKQNIHRLNNIIDIPFQQFYYRYLQPHQIDQLKPYYKPDISWFTFFTSIPKSKRCDLLYNWISNFVSDYLNNTYINTSWFIDVNKLFLNAEFPISITDSGIIILLNDFDSNA